MSARYPVLADRFRDEVVILRSRFLTTLGPVDTTDAAEAFIAAIGREFPDATHHCWAYLVGAPGSTSRVGMSDAGEPSGTAGRPMLNALVHGGVGDVVAVCSRWYGGTKLGTGGLARAYGGATKEALAAAPKTEKIEWVFARLSFDYARLDALKRIYARHEVDLRDEEFSDRVAHRVRLPVERLAGFADAVREESAGAVDVERIDDEVT